MEHKTVRVLMTMLILLSLLALPLAGCGDSQASTFERLKLDSGPISGTFAEGVWSYLGVPYAAPPVGQLRWKEPQAVQGWKDVRACTEYGPACPQKDDSEISAGDVGRTDEDCLYLNVWTPAAEPTDGLPVMVWIHGGGFTTGSGSIGLYNGEGLADRGVVVVTINYRLGPLGFLAHPSLSAEDQQGSSGDYGLLDQIAALEWVQRNIAAFGGDPDAVTVFGESAGGISVCDLMASPLADGLFDRAICESGPYSDLTFPSGSIRDLEEAERMGRSYAAALGCAGSPRRGGGDARQERGRTDAGVSTDDQPHTRRLEVRAGGRRVGAAGRPRLDLRRGQAARGAPAGRHQRRRGDRFRPQGDPGPIQGPGDPGLRRPGRPRCLRSTRPRATRKRGSRWCA